jgi:hypothetical protein
LRQGVRFSNERDLARLRCGCDALLMKIKQPMTEQAATRATISIVIAALVIAALGGWLFWHDRSKLDFEVRLREQRTTLESKVADAEQRILSFSELIPPEQEKVTKSEKIIRQLEDLQSTWDRFIGNRAQQRANNERLGKMRTLHTNAVARVAELQQQLARAKWDRDNHDIERTRIDSQLRVTEAGQSGAAYKLRRIWLSMRSWLCFGVSLYLLGPVLLPMVLEQRQRRKEGVIVGGRED